MENLIKNSMYNNTGKTVTEIKSLGKGAVGSVYRVLCKGDTKPVAVKISTHANLLSEEFKMLDFLRKNTKAKTPEVYFFDETKDAALFCMEFFEGVSGTDFSLRLRFNKKHLSQSIVDNLLVIQQAHNTKFGPYDNPVYDTWQEYYQKFSEEIYDFSVSKHSEGKLDSIVLEAVKQSYFNLDKILSGISGVASLTHGDYWMPNFIIDKKSMELLCAVDPFNMLWAEPEYELFAMTVGFGERLHLYETYKRTVKVTDNCDIKIEMYALFSELLWYKKLGDISHSYLKKRSANLLKRLNERKII